MSMFHFGFLLLTAVYLGFEIPVNTYAGHHYQKGLPGLHGSWYYNLIMLLSHTYMFGYLFIFKGFFFFFLCGLSLKTLLNLLQNCFCFMLWFSGHEACGILALQLRIEPAAPALEGEVLNTRPPGKSCFYFLNFSGITVNWHITIPTPYL